MRIVWFRITAAAALLASATPASAQVARRIMVAEENRRFYISAGFGAGQVTPQCDTGCADDALSANGIQLIVGWALTPRLRLEGGAQRLQTTGEQGGSHGAIVWAGAAWYPTSRLFVRGGVGQVSMTIADTVGVSEGSGAPGIMVGAGYDLRLSQAFVFTPYVNAFTGSIGTLEHQAGAGTTTTAGSVMGLHAGVSITFRPYRDENLGRRAHGPALPRGRMR